VVNEIVTDPQQDWDQTAGGTGSPFSGVPGSGTVSTADEYIELKNVSASTQSLEGYYLEMLDTTPSLDCFAFGATPAPGSCGQSAVYRVFDASGVEIGGGSIQDLLRNVPAAGYVILGNPAGSMNNGVVLVLHDTNAGVDVDTVDIGGDAPGGNASSSADEAVARLPDGADTDSGADDFRQIPVTLGRSNDEAVVPAPLLPRAAPGSLLLDVRPNPARNTALATVRSLVPSPTRVELLDASGRRVLVLVDRSLPAGNRPLEIPVAGLSSGVYFVRVLARGQSVTRKLAVIH
jgi:hypothetical protein